MKHKMAKMTEAELLKRIKGTQSGVWKGYEYEAEWWNEEWIVEDHFGPTYNWLWSNGLTRHLNRFYDNESNPGPAYAEQCRVWTEESAAIVKAHWANKATA